MIGRTSLQAQVAEKSFLCRVAGFSLDRVRRSDTQKSFKVIEFGHLVWMSPWGYLCRVINFSPSMLRFPPVMSECALYLLWFIISLKEINKQDLSDNVKYTKRSPKAKHHAVIQRNLQTNEKQSNRSMLSWKRVYRHF